MHGRLTARQARELYLRRMAGERTRELAAEAAMSPQGLQYLWGELGYHLGRAPDTRRAMSDDALRAACAAWEASGLALDVWARKQGLESTMLAPHWRRMGIYQQVRARQQRERRTLARRAFALRASGMTYERIGAEIGLHWTRARYLVVTYQRLLNDEGNGRTSCVAAR